MHVLICHYEHSFAYYWLTHVRTLQTNEKSAFPSPERNFGCDSAVFDRKADECPANVRDMEWVAPLRNFFLCLRTEQVEYAAHFQHNFT